MDRIDKLVETIRSAHRAYAPASGFQLQRLRQIGLPRDLIRFYERTDGASIHVLDSVIDSDLPPRASGKWFIMPAQELVPISDVYSFNEGSPEHRRCRPWIAVVDVGDSNYLAVNTSKGHEGEVIDCFCETVGQPDSHAIVARTFSDMLELLLSSPDAFWLTEEHRDFGAY